MPYEPFHDRFPEIAEKETRAIIAFNDPDLPAGEYGLILFFAPARSHLLKAPSRGVPNGTIVRRIWQFVASVKVSLSPQ